MVRLVEDMVLTFFIAMGVVLGGALVGALGATFINRYPLETMVDLARQIKVWGVLVAIGGTFDSIYILEAGLLEGQVRAVARQLIFILVSFTGAHLGYLLVLLLKGE